MFELGVDQAAGLRGHGSQAGPVLIPVASPDQPAQAYDLLCALASHLTALGQAVVVLDGTASETRDGLASSGNELGLLRALQDPTVAALARPDDAADWLVLPAALGMGALQETARISGPEAALSRLLSPFAGGVVVLLFAPADALSGLIEGLHGRPLVPMVAQPRATLDAYGALKELFAAGLSPVLIFQDTHDAARQTPLQKMLESVQACVVRHLGLSVQAWPYSQWGTRVLEIALGRPHPASTSSVHHCAPFAGQPAATHPQWS